MEMFFFFISLLKLTKLTKITSLHLFTVSLYIFEEFSKTNEYVLLN